MSKGNVFMGMSRGKIGDIVLTRLAGEQVARARNRAPKNPRTTKQMAQRAALATIVEFYTRGVKNLFKFAFESKSAKESDYNAFVKANMGIVPVQSHKTLNENGPVFGEFIVSQGSLNTVNYIKVGNYGQMGIGASGVFDASENPTVGDISKAFIKAFGLQDGDIITFVNIHEEKAEAATTMEEAQNWGALTANFDNQKWNIAQFTLDVSSTVLASNLGIFSEIEITDQGFGMLISRDIQPYKDEDPYEINMAGVIVSRNTPQGVKVSTCKLQDVGRTQHYYDLYLSDDWKRYVARHWNDSTSLNTDPENILEGSLSVNK